MKIYKKLFAYVQDKKYLGVLAIIFSAISALLTVYGYCLIYKFLDKLIINSNLSGAESIALKSVITLTSGAIFYFVSGMFSHILGFRLETNLRKRGIDGLEKASFRFFDLNPSGQIRKIIDDNAAQTHQVVAHMIPDSSQAIVTPILVLVLGFIVSIRVGITLLALTIIGGLILGAMMGEQEFMKIYQEALSKLSAETVEYVRGMQVVKIFKANVESFKSFYKAIKDYSKYAYDYSLSCKRPYVLYQWLFFGLIAILIIPIVYFMTSLASAKVILLELIMILFLSGVLFVSFMRMMWYSMYISQGNYAVDTLEALYEDMQKDKLVHGNVNNFKNYNIEFENVSFAYNDKAVIENLSFNLEEGKSYALVGSSGSGKSTVAKLISGFYNVNEGSIKIGGIAISEYSDEALIKAISFVFQDSKLFKKSIYDNVALANKDATKDDVMRALKLAGCDLILDKFPERENTIIGSKGVYLSGGEKQRIAIARAILKDSKIIIMDEASASIDPDNEFELQKAFKNLMKVLNGVSFKAKQGEVTALVGASGCGKTTILKLISRLYDYDKGQILIDGKDIKEISTESLFDKVSIVFQDVVLFNQSVMENIRIGKQDASDEEVKRAAKLANCTDFIEKMDKGFDTVIGENGAELSGGERQRLSIARAFLKDAPILILDEITASLDVNNEKKIQESLNNLVKDKTVVIISHRMKSIENADKIVVLQNGRVESEGKHEELLQKSKIYKNLIEKTKMAEEFIY